MAFLQGAGRIMGIINGFFIEPSFLHGFAASCHVLLLLSLLILWFCRRKSGGSSNKFVKKPGGFLFYKIALITCLILFFFHVPLFIFDHFWYIDGGGGSVSYEHLAIQVDLGIRAAAWLAISAYLFYSFNPSLENRFPALLRIWWGLFFLISFSSVLLDLFSYRKRGILSKHLCLLDFGSLFLALPLNYAGFFGKSVEEGSNLLHESLLNGVNDPDEQHSEIDSGIGNVSMFANANFLSILTFSWMGALLSVGHKKTLDLKDIPQLDHGDRVDGVFPIFKSKLESCTKSCLDENKIGNSNGTARISSFSLAKALTLSVWGHVLVTAIYALLYTVCSYVGPYLIDYFVQYLNGNQTFENEGYVLVLAFIVAKLFECLSQRHWFFKLQLLKVKLKLPNDVAE